MVKGSGKTLSLTSNKLGAYIIVGPFLVLMKYLQTTKGNKVQVDDDIALELSGKKCYESTRRGRTDSINIWHNNRMVGLARYIMGEQKDKQVDHVNRDVFDNRRENLRLCTNEENALNKGFNRSNSSGYPNVSFEKGRNKYRGYVGYKNRAYRTTYYTNPKDAYEEIQKIKKSLYGKFYQPITLDHEKY